MKIFAETDRLLLREIMPEDEEGMFELDSNPKVHEYLGNKPVQNREQIKEVIQFIRQQYIENGIARWAVVEKENNQFLGWAGLKLVRETNNNHQNYYDIGYRLIPKHWGKGYATEAAIAARDYAFGTMKLEVIYGATHIDNHASRHILEKIGLQFVETFPYGDITCNWLKMEQKDWRKNA